MDTKILYNPTDLDITDYKIEEAQYDQYEHMLYEPTGEYKKTGRTLNWSIPSKKKVQFPTYVADYLLQIYGFLQEVKDEKVKEEVPTAKGETSNVNCRHCGMGFKNSRALALHIASRHADKL